MGRDPAVCFRDLWFSFGRHLILEKVDFDIEGGDFVSLIGPNGGGKTTLLRLILGLLEPDRGSVTVFGRRPSRSRGRVGYMPQHVRFDADFPVTVMDVVQMGRLGKGIPIGPFRKEDREASLQALRDVEGEEWTDRPFRELSGGQTQRVLIARALASDPDLLLLDEPTANLDPGGQDDLYELLHRLNERMTLVLVSHDVSVVSNHVNKVACVNRTVDLHPSSALKGELARLFGDGDRLRLVRHDHSVGIPGEHPHHGDSDPDA